MKEALVNLLCVLWTVVALQTCFLLVLGASWATVGTFRPSMKLKVTEGHFRRIIVENLLATLLAVITACAMAHVLR